LDRPLWSALMYQWTYHLMQQSLLTVTQSCSLNMSMQTFSIDWIYGRLAADLLTIGNEFPLAVSATNKLLLRQPCMVACLILSQSDPSLGSYNLVSSYHA
jgi:hypothetical protein